MDDGGILYRPDDDSRIRPSVQTPVFTYADSIRDELTGYDLYKDFQSVNLEGFDQSLTVWKINRDKAKLPTLYVLTKNYQLEPASIFGRRRGIEIVHAHADSFFPFKDSLYPEDLALDRVAAMMDIQGLKKGRHRRIYFDNRLAYMKQNAELQRLRAKKLFTAANFEFDPMQVAGSQIYFPTDNSSTFDDTTSTATASTGSKLSSNNRGWTLGLDRSGVRSRVRAIWSDRTGKNKTKITMIPLRTYREGYGETRGVQVITERNSLNIENAATGPSGQELADLINMFEPIAGKHAGNLVVVDSRSYSGEWR